MKKAKLMLTAITVLAIVGGALAFKAQKFGTQAYCINSDENAQFCPNYLPPGSSFNAEDPKIAYRTTSGDTCPESLECTSKGHSFFNN